MNPKTEVTHAVGPAYALAALAFALPILGVVVIGVGFSAFLLASAGAMSVIAGYIAFAGMSGQRHLPAAAFWLVWASTLLFVLVAAAEWLVPIRIADADRGAVWLERLLSGAAFEPGRIALILMGCAAALMLVRRSLSNSITALASPLAPPLLLLLPMIFAAHQAYEAARFASFIEASFGFVAAAAVAIVGLGAGLLSARGFRNALFPLGYTDWRDAIDRNNRFWLWAYGFLMPIVASAGSFLYAAVPIWALASLLARRYPLCLNRADGFAIVASLSYGLVLIAVTVLHAGPEDDVLAALQPLLPCLGVPLAIARFRLSDRGALLRWLQFGAVAGLIVALPAALYDAFMAGQGVRRAMIFGGNPIVLGFVATILSMVVLLGLDRVSFSRRLLHVAAAVCGAIVVLLTGSFSLVATFPLLLVLVALRYPAAGRGVARRWRAFSPRRRMAAAALTVAIFLAATAPIVDRLSEAGVAPDIGGQGLVDSSLAKRLVMWRVGMEAFLDSPVTGYGVQNRFGAINPLLTPDERSLIQFSQLHNGYLTAAVAGGLLGLAVTLALLAAPLWTAWRWSRDRYRPDVLLLASSVSTVYAVAGVLGIMFFHDVLDTMFAMMLTLTAVLATPGPREVATSDPAGGVALKPCRTDLASERPA